MPASVQARVEQEPKILWSEGTLVWKTSQRLAVMARCGNLWWYEHGGRGVYQKWEEGLAVRVYYTDQYRAEVVALEQGSFAKEDKEAASDESAEQDLAP